MDSEHRSAISTIFVLLVAGTMTAVAVAPAPGSQALQTGDATNATHATTISVSATGDVQAEPDLAVLHLESAATASDPGTAAERLAANVSRLRTALRNANVSDENLTTVTYGVFEMTDRGEETPTANATRYRAEQVIAVEVTNTSRVGELIDVAVANGATGVRGVTVTLSEETRTDLRNRALEEAMGSARSEAETLAATEDLRITGVRSISTGIDGFEPFAARETAVAADAGTQIDSGPVTVRATVEVTYNATG